MTCEIYAERDSVCMGDDVAAPNAKTWICDEQNRISDLLKWACTYVPEMKNVVWTVTSGNEILGHLVSGDSGSYTAELSVSDRGITGLNEPRIHCRYWYAVRDYSVSPARDLYPECITLLEKVKAAEAERVRSTAGQSTVQTRTITVKRKSALANLLMPYWIIVSEGTKAEFMERHGMSGDIGVTDQLGYSETRIDLQELDMIGTRIENGKEVTIEVPETACSIFLSTMDGNLSNELLLRDCRGTHLLVTTRGGFAAPGCPHLETVK